MKTKHVVIYLAIASFVAALAGLWAADKHQKEHGITVLANIQDHVAWSNGVAVFVVAAEPAEPKKEGAVYLTYQWLKNGNPVMVGSNIFSVTNNTLIISNVQRTDVGFYACRITRVENNKESKPTIVGGNDCDNLKMPYNGARLFVVTGTNTVISGPYTPSPGTGTQCVGPYLGFTSFPVPGSNPPNYWHTRPGNYTKVKFKDISDDAQVAYYSKVQLWQSYYNFNTCRVSTLTYTNVQGPPVYYHFTTYVTNGSPPAIMDMNLTWF